MSPHQSTGSRLPRWAITLIGSLCFGALITLAVKLQSGEPERSDPDLGSSQQGSSQQGSPQQDESKSEPQVELRTLAPLKLLPTPSARWSELEMSTLAHPMRGALRVYRGGRLEDRLAQLTHDLYFGWRAGDPPLEAWRESATLRWRLLQLAPRDVISELTLDARAALALPQSVYLEQIARRPERERHAKLAEVIKTPAGLIVLNTIGKSCPQLKPGDLITAMSWRVPKQRRLNNSCERAECLNAHERTLKRKRSVMKVRLRLKVTRDEYKRRQWSTREVSLQCTLR